MQRLPGRAFDLRRWSSPTRPIGLEYRLLTPYCVMPDMSGAKSDSTDRQCALIQSRNVLAVLTCANLVCIVHQSTGGFAVGEIYQNHAAACARPLLQLTSFGDQLRELRIDADLTQEQLSDLSGLSVKAIGNLERGRATPRIRSVQLLLSALSPAAARQEELLAAARGMRKAICIPGRGRMQES